MIFIWIMLITLKKDITNSSDNIFGSNYSDFLFNVRKNDDNSMLAYKTIQISV